MEYTIWIPKAKFAETIGCLRLYPLKIYVAHLTTGTQNLKQIPKYLIILKALPNFLLRVSQPLLLTYPLSLMNLSWFFAFDYIIPLTIRTRRQMKSYILWGVVLVRSFVSFIFVTFEEMDFDCYVIYRITKKNTWLHELLYQSIAYIFFSVMQCWLGWRHISLAYHIQ